MSTCDDLLALKELTEGTLGELAIRYRDARSLARAFTDIADEIEYELVARMELDDVPVSGVGVLQRRVERRSAWRDEYASQDFRRDVGNAVVRKVALDIATGELDPIKRNVAQATIEVMYDVIPAFSSVKTGGRRLGISPGDYRTYSDVYKVTVEEGIADE